jgi:hypothetical protein
MLPRLHADATRIAGFAAWVLVCGAACRDTGRAFSSGAAPGTSVIVSTAASTAAVSAPLPSGGASGKGSSHAGKLAAIVSAEPTAADLALSAGAGAPRTAMPSLGNDFFQRLKIDDEELARIVQTSADLRTKVGSQHRLFTLGDAAHVQNRGREDGVGYTFSHLPVLWSPEDGRQYVVLTGRGKSSSYIAAFSVEGDQWKLQSSFVFQNDLASVVLAFRPSHRRELYWSSCWQCPGEQGQVSFREDKRVVIVQL